MAEKKKKLGRGLDAIFGADIDSILNEIDNTKEKSGVSEVEIEAIRPNPYQPRKTFDDESLKELAASIKENGVFQPIIIRKSVGGYELIAGERRLRSSKLLGNKTIPALIVAIDDAKMMEISLLENIQREDLSAIEEAEAYENLIEKLNYTQEKLAEKIGKSRVHVTNMLRILKLPAEIKKMVLENKLTYGQARTLLSIKDEDEAIKFAQRACREGLTVRQLEKMTQKKDKAPKREEKGDIYLENVRTIMERKLKTAVKVAKNKIVIEYNGSDDLNRILEIIDCLEEQD